VTEDAPETPSTDDALPPSAVDTPPAEPVDPLAQAQAEAARLKDQLLRTAADFDNFRKRSRKDVDDAGKRARDDVLRELLPVFDNLERAMSAADTATDAQSLADGIRMVQRQFLDTLGKLQIERVETTGKAFDPSLMEAVQSLATSDFEPGTVAAELQAGYRQGERLLRPALVVVAKAP
jgi:molecular chaperone GrpE